MVLISEMFFNVCFKVSYITYIFCVTCYIGTKSTTARPVTFPSLPPIDPNSNAYVVWSVGHGGSGWSYQKQGPNVKWSAQNSEAEGDSWSVVRKDDGEEKTNFSNQWVPIRQAVPDHQTSERNKNKVVSNIITMSKFAICKHFFFHSCLRENKTRFSSIHVTVVICPQKI